MARIVIDVPEGYEPEDAKETVCYCLRGEEQWWQWHAPDTSRLCRRKSMLKLMAASARVESDV